MDIDHINADNTNVDYANADHTNVDSANTDHTNVDHVNINFMNINYGIFQTYKSLKPKFKKAIKTLLSSHSLEKEYVKSVNILKNDCKVNFDEEILLYVFNEIRIKLEKCDDVVILSSIVFILYESLKNHVTYYEYQGENSIFISILCAIKNNIELDKLCELSSICEYPFDGVTYVTMCNKYYYYGWNTCRNTDIFYILQDNYQFEVDYFYLDDEVRLMFDEINTYKKSLTVPIKTKPIIRYKNV